MKSVVKLLLLFVIVFIPFSSFGSATNRIDPASLNYLGAFLMPPGVEYGGMKITFNPSGNGGNGSFYVVRGVDGGGKYLLEVSLATPVKGAVSGLNRASVLQSKTSAIGSTSRGDTQGQPAYSVAKGSQTSAKVYLPSYVFYNVSNSDSDSLGWVDTNLSAPNPTGSWRITSPSGGMVNKVGGYAFFVPQAWADIHTGGRSLILGYHRGFANQSSNGPTMFASAPWNIGNPPADGVNIPTTELLRYPSIDTAAGGTDNVPITNFRSNYSMSDHAKGGVWVEKDGKRAIVFVGVGGTQSNYCYGASCSASICTPRQGPNNPPYSPKFWWYDVDGFEATAAGSLSTSSPAPYAEITPADAYNGQCGASSDTPEFYQSVAFDSGRGILYATESVWTGTAEETVVHAYQIGEADTAPPAPTCSDGIQNGSEAGIDCGGSCNACPTGGVINVSNLSQLYAAFASERDGDEIVIAPGTYTLSGSALSVDANNITVRSSTGNRDDVIIQGDAMSSSAVVKSIFYFPQGLNGLNATIKDLTIGRVGWHTIFFNGNGSGNGTTIDNVRMFNSYEQIIKGAVGSTGVSNVTVKNSLFEFTTPPINYYTGGIDAHSADGWLVHDNVFKNIQSPSGSVAEHAVHFWSNTSFSGSNRIERNQIVNCDRGIGIWNGTGTNIIRNNMITSNGTGTFPDVGIDIQNTPNTQIYNNSIWIAPSGYYAAIELRGITTINSKISNNLTNKGIEVFSGAVATEQTNAENSQSDWFVNISQGDLHLANSRSEVVNQGTSISGFGDDFDGDVRDGQVDIGADEFSGTIIAPPPALRLN